MQIVHSLIEHFLFFFMLLELKFAPAQNFVINQKVITKNKATAASGQSELSDKLAKCN